MKVDKLSSLLYRDKTIDNIDKKIKLLGINYKCSPYTFMNIRILSSIFIFFVIIYCIDFCYILSPFVVYLYYTFLKEKKKKTN